LSLCSFEETTEILYDAGRFCQKDELLGVTEAIIAGKRPPVGTNRFDVFLNTDMLDMSNVELVKELPIENTRRNKLIEKEGFQFTSSHVEEKTVDVSFEFAPSSPTRE
jgi:DNA-directed RNA polymerase beta' subunit